MSPVLLSIGLISACLLLLWLLSLALKNAAIIDLFWGPGFALITLVGALTAEGAPARRWLLAALVAIWAVRLSAYIYWRNRGKPEDYRYQAWRRESGANWWWYSFFKVFALQGAIMLLLAPPLWAAQASPTPASLTWLDYLGTALWAAGLCFEAVGDFQLARFKADPANRGKVMQTGLWRYTRHPNYFGDALLWWGYGMIALSAGAWQTLYAPLVMTLLLLRVSGVALLEKGLVQTKPQYAEYIRTTSAFFPLPPRRPA